MDSYKCISAHDRKCALDNDLVINSLLSSVYLSMHKSNLDQENSCIDESSIERWECYRNYIDVLEATTALNGSVMLLICNVVLYIRWTELSHGAPMALTWPTISSDVDPLDRTMNFSLLQIICKDRSHSLAKSRMTNWLLKGKAMYNFVFEAWHTNERYAVNSHKQMPNDIPFVCWCTLLAVLFTLRCS
jgi:hypothetical protein